MGQQDRISAGINESIQQLEVDDDQQFRHRVTSLTCYCCDNCDAECRMQRATHQSETTASSKLLPVQANNSVFFLYLPKCGHFVASPDWRIGVQKLRAI